MRTVINRVFSPLLAASLLTLVSGCGETHSFTSIPNAPAATSTPAPTTQSSTITDFYRTVSAGPSLSFNNLTGGVNDLVINPVTKLPSVIYYDKSSTASGTTALGALKYAYMDSMGGWRVEVVDANYGTALCGVVNSFCLGAPNVAAGNTASIMKLAFRSDGTPAIAYVFGASVATVGGTKQVRFAERSTFGTWSVSAPFSSPVAALATNVATAATVDPIKGVTLTFDTQDRPHIQFAFYTQTITSSELRYLFRSSTGSWTSSTITSAVSGAGTITAVGQGVNQAGGVLCRSSNKVLWSSRLINAAAGVGQPLYITCTATDTAGACNSFTTLNLAAGCAGATSCFSSIITTATDAGSRSDIVIDAGTLRPLLAIYSNATPATTLLTAPAPASCEQVQSSAAAAWGTPLVVGAASQGLNGLELLPSTSALNFNFLIYLTGAASVNVNKATGVAGAWLATGATVENVVVASEGVGGAYDSTNDILYTSYAAVPAAAAGATGNDIKVAYTNQAEIVNAGAAGVFITENIDNTNNFFPSTALPVLSAAKSSTGTIGFAFFYQDATATDAKLYYGVRSGNGASPSFGLNAVVNHVEGAASPQFVGSYPSLIFDSSNNPAIAFYNGVAAQQNLNVARSTDGGSNFTVTVVDDVAANVGLYPSIALTSSALGVAYYDSTNTGLKLARYSAAQGWRKFFVDGVAGTGSCGNAADDAGSFVVLKFTSTGNPVIAYQSQNALKVAYATEAIGSLTYTWNCLNLDNSANTRAAGISMDIGSDDRIHILHFDATAGSMRYVTCASSAASCFASGSTAFSGSVLEGVGSTTAISTKPALRLSGATVYASYYSASSQRLRLATLLSGSTWSFESLDTAPNSTFVSQVGQYADMVINSFGYPTLFYRSNENWLRYFSRELQ